LVFYLQILFLNSFQCPLTWQNLCNSFSSRSINRFWIPVSSLKISLLN
jgi:hypothetical protein